MKKIAIGLFAAAGLAAAGYFTYINMVPKHTSPQASTLIPASSGTAAPSQPVVSKRQQLLGKEFRALYITSWTAGINRFQTLIDMAGRSYLNAVVIDIKDSTGRVGYDS